MLQRYRGWAADHLLLNRFLTGVVFAAVFVGLSSVGNPDGRTVGSMAVLFVICAVLYGAVGYVLFDRRRAR